jgi:hypothetical protein
MDVNEEDQILYVVRSEYLFWNTKIEEISMKNNENRVSLV